MASSKIRLIEESLKSSGILERTQQEKLERELDVIFPNARSREVGVCQDSCHIKLLSSLTTTRLVRIQGHGIRQGKISDFT